VLASPAPDGLNRVAADLGFSGQALAPLYEVFSGYSIPFLANENVSKAAAVVFGTLVVFGVAWALARIQRKAAA
jgi:hypothetical protein